MQTALIISLLPAFIAMGVSLECEICEGLGHICEGTMHTCPPGFDRCGITLMKSSVGMNVHSIVKTCVPASSCNHNFTILNMGKIGTMAAVHLCCVGQECKIPTLPPIDTKPNGKVCPACYAIHTLECEEEIIQCTGDELYCLEVSGTANVGALTVTTISKGCTNNAACQEMREGSASFAGITVAATQNCTLAPQKASTADPRKGRHISSGVTTILPAWFEFFFPVLAGFLLVKNLA